MASSQIEIASSSPFGCVLRDRNHRDGCSREVNKVKATHVAFQRNIKNFVMDHLNTCMSLSSDSTTNENNNCTNNTNTNNNNDNNASSWVSKAAKNNLARLRFTRTNQNNDKNINNEESGSFLASLISPRHSRLLDRWAARQAREMVTTLEDQAELLAIDDNNINNNNSSSSNDNDIECSSEITKLGASSLVQIWEKRLNKSNGSKPNTPVERTTSPNAGAVSSATSNNENVFEEQRGLVEAGECTFEGPSLLSSSTSGINEESFPDWESSDQSISPPRGRWYSSESDRVSVADIIKKLTATSQTQSPTPSFADDNDHEGGCGSSSVAGSPCRDFAQENSDHRAFPTQVTSSPRIRGRQAFNDLLMQLENDRHGELKNLAERGAVSKFSQRGRIQATLRLRLLQRGVAANDPSRQKPKSSEVNRQVQPRGSAIMQLREIFSSAIEKRSTVQAEVTNVRSPRREVVNNNTQLENSPTPTKLGKRTSSQTAQCTANHSTESTQNSVSQNREECDPSSDVTFQETCFKAQHDDSQETAEAATSMTDSNLIERAENVETSNQQCAISESSYVETETVDEEEASNQQYAETCYNSTAEEEPSNQQYAETRYHSTAEEEASNQNYAESSYEEMVEDFETIEQNYDENNYDWISEISRPRSYWEERRQAWYREMLDTGSPKEDIRDLLQRKTVSTFLSSDFRETMDRLMQSHRGTQTHLLSSQDDEEDNQGLIAFLQERVQAGITPQEDVRERVEEEEVEMVNQEEEEEDVGMVNQEEEEEEADEQEHEGESLISSSCREVGDYSNQSSSWSFRDNEAGDDFDRVASTSSQPYQSQSFYQDSRRNSSPANHHSIEMELIYDLRGHMENLYHEMSELRKSIKGCMDMQMQLQQSMIQGVPTVKKEEKKSHNKAPRKGNCCICYEMKADSVLYRCGHMCTCLKCANELQWNSGKCPICRAKIVDVVRVYVDA